MGRWIHWALAAGIVLSLAPAVRADEMEKTLAELRERLAKVEARLIELEKRGSQADARREAFRARMAADAKKYTPAQLKEAEDLYQTMNNNWRSDEGKAALEKLIDKYPDINRTGCAVLYLGQVSSGADKEKHLKSAMEKYGDSMYGDGVVVGAYARYLLALHYRSLGKAEESGALIADLKAKFPAAVNHKGTSLVDLIEQTD